MIAKRKLRADKARLEFEIERLRHVLREAAMECTCWVADEVKPQIRGGVTHGHRVIVPGCPRCDLAHDETEAPA